MDKAQSSPGELQSYLATKIPEGSGETPMHLAAKTIEVMTAILENVPDKLSHEKLQDLLLKKDSRGQTPMHLAKDSLPLMTAIVDKIKDKLTTDMKYLLCGLEGSASEDVKDLIKGLHLNNPFDF